MIRLAVMLYVHFPLSFRNVEDLLHERGIEVRPRCNDRLALAGIIFVLRSGILWEMLPRELGCSGMTCWRRLRD